MTGNQLSENDRGMSVQENRCKCNSAIEGKGRNLVVCIDGTSNQFGEKNTNIIELYSKLVKDTSQLTYYNSGIGAYARTSWKLFGYWKKVLDNKIDLMIAWHFEKIVMHAYRWLADNYLDGDRIFLFGWSRGAYQIRALAGMINKVGLIHKGNDEQIPFPESAYELYADHTNDVGIPSSGVTPRLFRGLRSSPSIQKATKPVNLAQRFKDTFSRSGVRVHFTGVWDTVSSVGIIRGKNLPETDSPEHICFFRHALALDEHRVKFLPEYARGGVMGESRDNVHTKGLDEAVRNTSLEASEGDANECNPTNGGYSIPHVKEVWFSGTHSDIGGGIFVNYDLDRRHPAFLWMSYEAASAGLLLNSTNVDWKWDELGDVHESLTGVWKLFEFIPFRRLSYEDAETLTFRLHRGQGRRVQPGQKIHASVAFCPRKYRPKAILPSGKPQRDWNDLVGRGTKSNLHWTQGWEDLLEMDIFDVSAAEVTIRKISDPLLADPMVWVHRLAVMTWTAEGCQMLRLVDGAASRLFQAIQNHKMDIKLAVANSATEFILDESELMMLLDVFQRSENVELFERYICDVKPTSQKLKVVRKLAEYPDFCGRMFDCNVITVLLASFSDGHSSLRISAVNSIAAAARYCLLRSKLLELGLVDKFLFMLRDTIMSMDVRLSAREVMEELFKHNDSRCKMLESGIVISVQEMLHHIDSGVRVSALDVIAELVKHDDSLCKTLEYEVVTPVLESLNDAFQSVRRSSLRAIVELAKYDGSRHILLESDIITSILGALDDEDESVRCTALDVMTELASHDDSRSNSLNSGAIGPILAMLGDKSPFLHWSVQGAIVELAKHDDSRRKMLELDVVTFVLATFGDKSPFFHWSARGAVMELVKHTDSRRKMLESGIVASALAMLRDKSAVFRLLARNVLVELAKHDDSRRKIIESDIIASISIMLADKSSNVCRLALESIVERAKYDDSRCKMLGSDISANLQVMLPGKIGNERQSIEKAIEALSEPHHGITT